MSHNANQAQSSSQVLLIEASAGTGKTYTITKQIAQKIKSSTVKIEQVMVVTFTNKSAQDMTERIYEALEEELESEEITEQEVLNVKAALRDFEQASIGTIHAIAHDLLLEYEYEHKLEVPSSLSSEEAYLASELVENILLELLGQDTDRSWHRVLKENYYYDLKKILEELVKNMISSSYLKDRSTLDMSLLSVHFLEAKHIPKITNLKSHIDSFSKIMDQIIELVQDLINNKGLKSTGDQFIKSFMYLSKYEFISGADYPKKFGIKHQAYVKEYKQILDLVNQLTNSSLTLAKSLDHFETLSQAGSIQIQDFDLWEFFNEVKSNIRFQVLDYIARVLLPRCEEQLRERKQSKSELSYDSLLVLFNQASLNHDFAQLLRDRFQVLFIDEFQDTNLLQWRSFSQIFIQPTSTGNKPTKMILVGDPKQAIYAFRGGDIHTYTEVKNSGVTTQSLDCNFRSDPLLICGLNTLYTDDLGLNVFEYYKSVTSDLPEVTESFLKQIKDYQKKLSIIDVDQSILEKVQSATFFKTHLNNFIKKLPILITEFKGDYSELSKNGIDLFLEKVQDVIDLTLVDKGFKKPKITTWTGDHSLYYKKISSTFPQLKSIINSVKLYCYSLLNTHKVLTDGLGKISPFVKNLDYVQVKYPIREGIEKKTHSIQTLNQNLGSFLLMNRP